MDGRLGGSRRIRTRPLLAALVWLVLAIVSIPLVAQSGWWAIAPVVEVGLSAFAAWSAVRTGRGHAAER